MSMAGNRKVSGVARCNIGESEREPGVVCKKGSLLLDIRNTN